MTIALIGDLYTPAERPRVQGIVATVWAAAAVLGEGAALTRMLSQPTDMASLARAAHLRGVFDAALHWSFWGGDFVAGVLTAAVAWTLPVRATAA